MRRRAFPGSGPEIDLRYQRAYHWLLAAVYESERAATWCDKNGIAVVRAAGEGIGSSGAFLVPTELAAAILDLRELYGAFRRRARPVPMASDSTAVPRRPGGTGAFFMSESSAATESNVNVDDVGLTAKKIGTLIRLSSELNEDSLVDSVDFVANEIAWAFAALEDDCAFNGDGSSAYGGMRGIGQIVLDGVHGKAKVTAAGGHNTYGTLDTTDLGSLIAGVQGSAIPNAAWFCSQTCFALTFCRLAGSGGGGYLDTRVVDGIATPFYLGFPVILTQKFPLIQTTLTGKTMLAFGDMYGGAVLGERRRITLARSADRYMDQDQIAVLGTERFDAVVHDMGDNSNPGMLAALVAP